MSGSDTSTGAPWGVYGQQPAVSALQHAIATGRLSHAYLFTGPDAVGKATLARRLAQALVCAAEADARPCLACRACTQLESDAAPDIERIAIGGVCDEQGHRDHATDGSTRIRICQVRRLARVAHLAPFSAPRRIFILDSADDLQPEAAHALLKTLEEPPATVLLVLLAADPDSLLPTLRSRCQELALRPMPRAELAAALLDAGVPAAEAERLAADTAGRFGRALREHRDPSLGLLREAATADLRRLGGAGRNERFDYAETLARRWTKERQSVLDTLDVWRTWWRAALRQAADGTEPPAATSTASEDAVPDAASDPPQCTPREALRALAATQRTREHLLANTNPQLALEVLMLDLPLLPEQPAIEAPDGDALTPDNGKEAREAVASR